MYLYYNNGYESNLSAGFCMDCMYVYLKYEK